MLITPPIWSGLEKHFYSSKVGVVIFGKFKAWKDHESLQWISIAHILEFRKSRFKFLFLVFKIHKYILIPLFWERGFLIHQSWIHFSSPLRVIQITQENVKSVKFKATDSLIFYKNSQMDVRYKYTHHSIEEFTLMKSIFLFARKKYDFLTKAKKKKKPNIIF